MLPTLNTGMWVQSPRSSEGKLERTQPLYPPNLTIKDLVQRSLNWMLQHIYYLKLKDYVVPKICQVERTKYQMEEKQHRNNTWNFPVIPL